MNSSALAAQFKRAVVLGCALICVLLSTSAVASAQADSFTWLGPSSLMSTGGSNALPSVSCPSASQCTTVDGRGEQVTFNGTTVLTHSAVDLIGSVNAVSCPSTTQCTAVDNGGNEITFDPSSGAVNSFGRKPVDPPTHLNGVSCASGTRCTAVDASGNEVTFDPSSGAKIGSVNPIDGTTPLSAVSCLAAPSGQQCTAVDSAGKEITITVSTAGTITSTTVQAVDGTTALRSVSCPSTSQCTAVDGAGAEITFTPTTGTLIGAATAIDGSVPLQSVSCPSSTQCVAVDTTGNEVSFSPSASPAPSVTSVDGTTSLGTVSCPAGTSSCTALDNQGREITFTTAGVISSHGSIDAPQLDGISCPTRTQCTTVANGSTEVTFDPTSGTINAAGVKTIDHSGNPLTGISCVSSTECTAVDNGGNAVTFDPTTGNVIANGFFSVDTSPLRSVACLLVSGTPQCTAVDTAGSEVTFNPSSSTINNAGLSPVDGSGGIPQSVACPSGTLCTAVDNHGNEVTFNPVTGLYYGTQQWVSVDPGQSLNAVDCLPVSGQIANNSQCTAVDAAGGVVTFLDPAATPAIPHRQVIEVSSTALAAISCPSTTQCTAVDALGMEATFSPASTSLDSTLLTALPQAGALGAIDCQSASICAAVDAEGNGFAGIVPPADTTLPTITGQAQQGVQLSETNGSWTNFPTGYSYVWEDCSSSGASCSPIGSPTPTATMSTYTPTASDIGDTIRVQEIASNQGGSRQQVVSAATLVVTPSPAMNSAPPTISTNASSYYQQGQALTENPGTWTEASSAQIVISYQWDDCDASGAHCAAISGATAQTYTPVASDVGKTLRVREKADNGGTPVPAAVPSAVTPVIQHAPPANTATAQIQGSPIQQGQALTVRPGTWTNTDGASDYSYQWMDCDGAGAHCTAIPGATGTTYTPGTSDVGDELVVLESVDNGGQPAAPAVPSAPTSVVLPTPPGNSSPPTIAGEIQQGTTLTEGHGGWSSGVDAPTGYSYQWENCTASGANCAAIAGATSPTYTPVTADVGRAIVLLETATNAGGSGTPAASAPTAPVAPAPAPAIQALTRPAQPVSPIGATVQAVLSTQGQTVTFQFVYGQSTAYSAGTPIQTKAAGSATPATVSWPLTNLKPSTTYHYRIVETVAATQYTPAATAYGQDLTFTTASLGKIVLSRKQLVVSSAGTVAVPLSCQSALACVDRFSITTPTQVGHGSTRHLGSVLCNTDLTRLAPNSHRSVTVTLTRACLDLLQAAPGRRLTATVTTRPRSGQLGFGAKITLIGPKTLKLTHGGRRSR